MSLVLFFTAFRPLDPIPPEPSTPYICAPEILIRTLRFQGDIWSLGCSECLEVPGSIPDIMISTTQKYLCSQPFLQLPTRSS